MRRLSEWGYRVVATGGPVSNSPLGVAEAEAFCGVPCFSGERVLAGELVPALRSLRTRPRGRVVSRARASRPAPKTAVGATNGRGSSAVTT